MAVQIGIVDRAGLTLLDTYVKPHKPIPAGATQVHGITDEMVATAPTILELESEIFMALHGRAVLIYNAEYDARILRQSFLYSGAREYGDPYRLPINHFVHIDTFKCVMEWFAQFYGDWNDYRQNYKWQKLSIAALVLGVQISNAHSAIGDALMTLGVVSGMAEARLSGEPAQPSFASLDPDTSGDYYRRG